MELPNFEERVDRAYQARVHFAATVLKKDETWLHVQEHQVMYKCDSKQVEGFKMLLNIPRSLEGSANIEVGKTYYFLADLDFKLNWNRVENKFWVVWFSEMTTEEPIKNNG